MNTTETKQMLFDKMWRGLESQGWERSMGGAGCVYRGEEGRKCAVGHCIPDDVYDPMMEGYGVDDVADKFDEVVDALPFFRNTHILDFLYDAQDAHDNAPIDMKERFRELAAEHGLTIPGEVAK